MRGDVAGHVAQAIPQVDAEIGEIDHLWMETSYDVASHTDPNEALEIFRENRDKTDLVITDMAMPDMTGDILVEELRRTRADIPIILCTGHSELIDQYKAKELGINAYALKPLIRKLIAQTIREVLG